MMTLHVTLFALMVNRSITELRLKAWTQKCPVSTIHTAEMCWLPSVAT